MSQRIHYDKEELLFLYRPDYPRPATMRTVDECVAISATNLAPVAHSPKAALPQVFPHCMLSLFALDNMFRPAAVPPIQLPVVGVEGAEDVTLLWSQTLFGISAGLSSAGYRHPALAPAICTSIAAGWSKSSGCASSKMSICSLKNGV